MDNDLPAIQGLGVGDTLTDTLTVTNVDTVTTTSVTITINGAADTLRLDPSTGSVTEDADLVSGNLVTSGTVTATGDADETPFTAETDISGTYGTLDITAAGAWTYKVDNDLPAIQGLGVGDTLTDTLTVTNVDTVTTTSVTITINGAADTLRLDPSTGSVTEDTGVNDAGDLVTSGTVTATGDADETPFTAETDISGTYGTLDITAAGAWTYKVDNDLPAIQGLGVGDTLTDTLTVTNVDTVTTTSVTITINGAADTLRLDPSTGSVTEDTGVNDAGDLVTSGTVTATGDADETPFTAETDISGTYGTLDITAAGAWTYKVDNDLPAIQGLGVGDTLTDTLTVTNVDTVTTTSVTITINGAADTLRLDPSTGSVTEDADLVSGNLVTSGTVTATGDADETPFTAETDISGTYGTLDITAAGAWTYKVDNDLPAIQGLGVGDTLTDTLTVTNVDTVTTTSVTITINGAADTLRLDPSTGSVTEDADLVSGNLVTSGTVTATGDADETPFTAETDISGTYGTLDITAAGAWTYKVDNDLPAIQGLGVGDTLTDTLTVTNVDTVTTTSVTITINGAADTLRLDPSTGSVTEDTGVNDAGDLVTSGTVTATGDADETPFTAETDISGTYGTLDITAAGAWTYKVDNDLPAIQGLGVGDTLTDTLTVTNVDTVTTTSVTITINGAADTLRLDPSTGSVTEDTGVNDAGDLVTSGTVTATGDADETPFTAETDISGTYGTLDITAAGAWTYKVDNDLPAIQGLGVGDTLTDTLTVTNVDTVTTTSVTITINGAADTLRLDPSTGSVTEDTGVNDAGDLVTSGTVTATGDADETPFTAETDISGTYGTLDITAAGAWTYKVDNDLPAIQGLGVGDTLTDTLTVTNVDTVTTTSVIITINGVNDAPVLEADAALTAENDKLTVADGTTATTITVTDDKGNTITDDKGDTITIIGNADLLINDIDADGDTLKITQITGFDDQTQPMTVVPGTAVGGSAGGQFTIKDDGSWSFDPGTDFDYLKKGETFDTLVRYTVSDGNGEHFGSLTVRVVGVDDVPTLTADTGTVTEDTALVSGNLVASGTVGASGGDAGDTQFKPETISVTGTHYGSLKIEADGDWTYTADNSDSKIQGLKATDSPTDTFTVTSADGVTTTMVTITINGVDDVPTLTADTGTVTEDTALVSGNLVASGTVGASGGDAGDTQFKPETISVTGTHYGSLKIEADGDWTYTADNSDSKIQGLKATDSPTDTFTVTSADGVTTTMVTITINGVDDVPTLTADTGTVTEDTALVSGNLVASGTVGASGGDAGDTQFKPETISVTGTHYGSLKIEADGDWTYTADNSDSKIQGLKATDSPTDTFTVTSADGVTTTMVTITINGVDDVPTLTADTGTVTEDTALVSGNLVASGTVGASGGDAGDTQFKPETISVTGTHYGSLKIEADGDWTYTADNSDSKIQGLKATDSPTDTFTVTSADGVTTTMVTITINGVDDVPTLTADTGTVTEDTALVSGNLVASGTVGASGGDAGDTQFKPETISDTGTHYGSLKIEADGDWTYTVANSDSKIQGLKATDSPTDTFTVTGADGVTTTMVTITINGVDDEPTLTADTGTVTEDVADADDKLVTTGTVGASGGDAGDTQFKPETISDTGTHYGSLKIEADGDWTYTADNSDSKIQGLKATDSPTDTFTVTSADGVTTTMVTITINGADDEPMLTASKGMVTEDADDKLVTTGTVGASGGDAGDTQFKPETISVTGTHYGSLKIEADGDWTYTADNSDSKIQGLKATDSPTDTFTVTSADGVTTTMVTITIRGADDEPMLTADTGTVTEDVADASGNLVATGTVGASGGDAGDTQFKPETISVTGTHYGSLKIEADGDWTYTAANSDSKIQGLKATDSPSDTFTVTSADGVTTTMVTITINGVNDAPMLGDDAALTTENDKLTVADGTPATTITVTDDKGNTITDDKGDTITTTGNADLLINDVDIDGDDLKITKIFGFDDQGKAKIVAPGTVVGGSAGGQFTVSANGAWSFNPGTDFDYLAAGGTFDTLVAYTVSDGNGEHMGSLTVRVVGVDDAPMLTADTGTVTEDAEDASGNLVATGTVKASGGDAGDTQFKPETISVTGTHYGSLKIEADGDWTYTADNSDSKIQGLKATDSPTDTFTVTSADGATTTTVTITINGVDYAPVAVADVGVTAENTKLTVKDGDAATPTIITDDKGSTSTITGNADLLLNDTDADGDSLTITGVKGSTDVGQDGKRQSQDVAAGVATFGDKGGSFTIRANGAWEFDPGTDFDDLKDGQTRTTEVTYTVSDGTDTHTATLTVTVTGEDDVPVLTAGTDSVTEDVAVSGNLVASGTVSSSDGDTGESGFRAETVTGSVGSLEIAADGAWTYTAANSQPDIQGLKAGETLTDTLTVTSADTVTTTTVTITINGADDAPVANDDTGNTAENTPLTVADGGTGTTNADLLLNDTDPDGDDLTITEVAGDTANVGSATVGDNGGSFTIRADGSWRFDPGSDFDGLAAGATATTSVEYTASDGTLTDTATLTVTVTGEADAPSLTAATGAVTEDSSVNAAGDLVASGTIGSSGGDTGNTQFRAETVTGDYGSLRIDASGDWRYTAANSQSAIQGLSATDSLSDAFTVTSADRVTTTTVTITINGADDTPSLTAATATLTEDTDVNDAGNLVASGTVGSSGGDAGETRFRAETLSGDYGSLRIDASGDWRYTVANNQSAIQGLNAGDSLTDAFTVTSADRVTTTTVSITINGADDVVLPPPAVNEAPTATDDAGSTVADTVLTVAGEAIGSAAVNAGLLLNDSDPEGDSLRITAVGGFSRAAEGNYQPLQEAVAAGTRTLGSNGGQFTIEADGSWRFDPDADFDDLAPDATRTTALTYTVSDGNGGTDTATLTVTVRGADDVPPTLVTDTVVTGTGSAPTPAPALSTIDPAAPPSEAGLRRPDADEDADDEADSDNFLVPDQFWGTADDPDPVRLGISLDEQRIPTQGSSTIVLPSNTFVHVDPGTLIRVEASLEDGSDLPGYVIFDPDTLSFEVDGEAAAAAGVGELTVLLTGRDAAGNSDFGVFVINLRDVEEDTEDETGAGQLLPAADASPAATEADGGELEESADAGSAATGAEDGAEADGNEPEQSDAAASGAGQPSADNNEKDSQEQAAAQKNFDSQLEQVSRNNFMDSIEQLLEDVKTLLL